MPRILLMFCLLLTLSVQARDFEGGYAAYGAGARSCAEYTKAAKAGGSKQDFYLDWVIGYFSAFNVIIPETYDILGEMDFPKVQEWLDIRCKKYPHELFINSVAKMTTILYPTRYKSGLKNPPARQLNSVSKAIKK